MRQSPLGVVTKKPASLWLLPARRGVLALGVYLPRLVTAACYLVHSLRILCGVSLYRPLSPAYHAGSSLFVNHFGRIFAAAILAVLCRAPLRGCPPSMLLMRQRADLVISFTYPRILCGFPPLVSGFLFLLFTPCERPA